MTRRVGPGETISIPAGVPHAFVNDGAEDAVSIQRFSPALDTERFFRTYFELARRGELNRQGLPSLLRMAVLVPEFADEIRVTRPPWWLQRTVFALLRPLARRRHAR